MSQSRLVAIESRAGWVVADDRDVGDGSETPTDAELDSLPMAWSGT